MDTENVSPRNRQRIRTEGGAHVEKVEITDGDFVGRDQYVYSRSEREELDDYLARAVAAYEGEKGLAVLQSPSRFDEPYKFLDAFSVEDRQRFFGRDEAQHKLHDKVLQDRLTVVHAKSGAGKTSLLSAGLAPRLIGEGRLPVYARAYQDPVRAIKQAIAAHAQGPWPALLSKLTLREFLKETCAHLSRRTKELVLILDQFEEFFVFFPMREHRQPFIDELADCYDDASLPLRAVITLRKDYLSDLADLEERIPTIFGNQYRLDAMTREEARAAITQPLTQLDKPVAYEEALLEALLNDLARGGMELPPLQILCTQLYRGLKEGETCITLASYEALGGAKGILSDYLNSELAKLGMHSRIAREVLKELVSSEGTKRVLRYRALAAWIGTKVADLDRVLAWLVNRRLLRRDEDEVDGEIRYEMVHEYLIDEIKKWIDPADLALKQAQELLAGEVATWRRSDRTLLIPRDRLELLYAQRERLRGLDDESWECILCSAMQANFAFEDWATLAGSVAQKCLLTGLGHANEQIRWAAVRCLGMLWRLPAVFELGNRKQTTRALAAVALGELGDARAAEPLIAALRDKEGDVRRAAAEALGRLDDPRAVEPLIAALSDVRVRGWAAEALGRLGDKAVGPLIAALGVGDVSPYAAEVLAKWGDKAVEPLIVALSDQDGAVREGAAAVLAELSDARAVEPLIAALSDQNGGVRRVAAVALRKLGDARAVEPLMVALRDEVGDVRQAAAEGLGRLGGPRAVEPLIAALSDQDGDVRKEAAWALGSIGTPQALMALGRWKR